MKLPLTKPDSIKEEVYEVEEENEPEGLEHLMFGHTFPNVDEMVCP